MAQPASRAQSRTRPTGVGSSFGSVRGEGSSSSASSRVRTGRNGSMAGASSSAVLPGKMADSVNGVAGPRTKRAALSDKSNIDASNEGRIKSRHQLRQR
ncbi:hypothetical protein CBOM_04700 [Ceraceosorus bombacis]|uniref:Uncharacterized protein n=1 Tax=Ceraceosorus bombacis TaxID=401625 RepID=A0A0N7LB36_9BASI|nr:hypothetical protein CBOM_04700 [Ceraceosorus bombacis]